MADNFLCFTILSSLCIDLMSYVQIYYKSIFVSILETSVRIIVSYSSVVVIQLITKMLLCTMLILCRNKASKDKTDATEISKCPNLKMYSIVPKYVTKDGQRVRI